MQSLINLSAQTQIYSGSMKGDIIPRKPYCQDKIDKYVFITKMKMASMVKGLDGIKMV